MKFTSAILTIYGVLAGASASIYSNSSAPYCVATTETVSVTVTKTLYVPTREGEDGVAGETLHANTTTFPTVSHGPHTVTEGCSKTKTEDCTATPTVSMPSSVGNNWAVSWSPQSVSANITTTRSPSTTTGDIWETSWHPDNVSYTSTSTIPDVINVSVGVTIGTEPIGDDRPTGTASLLPGNNLPYPASSSGIWETSWHSDNVSYTSTSTIPDVITASVGVTTGAAAIGGNNHPTGTAGDVWESLDDVSYTSTSTVSDDFSMPSWRTTITFPNGGGAGPPSVEFSTATLNVGDDQRTGAPRPSPSGYGPPRLTADTPNAPDAVDASHEQNGPSRSSPSWMAGRRLARRIVRTGRGGMGE